MRKQTSSTNRLPNAEIQRLEELIKTNLKRTDVITSAEFHPNPPYLDYLEYHLGRGRKTQKKCQLLKDCLKMLITESYYGIKLEFSTKDERKSSKI